MLILLGIFLVQVVAGAVTVYKVNSIFKELDKLGVGFPEEAEGIILGSLFFLGIGGLFQLPYFKSLREQRLQKLKDWKNF